MTKQECIWWVNHLFNIAKVREWNNGHVEDAKEIETAQQMAIDALKQTAWIPVWERLLDADNFYIISDGKQTWVALYDDGDWMSVTQLGYTVQGVTAWKPLPEPYKGGEDDGKKKYL